MRTPSLAELPAPPSGRTGWPWTEETSPLPAARPDGSPWPRVSIVTPSYNQGRFIEETIRSILLQSYPDLEYLVIDGSSDDETVAIIKKYEPWLAYWVSEKDHGQAHAINKGLARCTGEIFQFINSDDVLVRGGLRLVAGAFTGDAVVTSVLWGYNTPEPHLIHTALLSAETMLNGVDYMQPGLWLKRDKVMEIGIDESLHYNFPWELAIRYLERFPTVSNVPEIVVNFRVHEQSKSTTGRVFFAKEAFRIRASLSRTLITPTHREICRRMQQRSNWERRLTMWRNGASNAPCPIVLRMVRLALRKPRQRVGRFWLGALRRTAFQES
jgi:glycosyltransferase involved in cell wall biosynthesis